MKSIAASSFVALSLLVACGGGDSSPVDAQIIVPDAPPDSPPPPPDAPEQQLDLSCMNNPAPTTAPATITLSGTATDINVLTQMPVPVADATVLARNANDVMVGAPDMTDAAGVWTLSNLPTGMVPLDGYMEATKSGHRTTRVYPPEPLTGNQSDIPVPLLSNATFSTLVSVAGANQSPNNGTVGLVVLDCVATPVAGATISVTQNGTEVGEQFDASVLQDGLFVVFDVPPGATVVNASINGTTFRAHTITVVAATTSGTIVQPGFAN